MNISAILSCFAWCNSHINALLLDAADRNVDLRKIFLQLHSTDSVVCKNWIGFLSWWITTYFCKVATSWWSSILTNIFRFVCWNPCEGLDCQTCQETWRILMQNHFYIITDLMMRCVRIHFYSYEIHFQIITGEPWRSCWCISWGIIEKEALWTSTSDR